MIRFWPDKLLSSRCSPVPEGFFGTEEAAELDTDLRAAMTAFGAQGVAANQVGRTERAFAIRGDDDEVLVVVNPELTDISGEIAAREGCLSFPFLSLTVRRAASVCLVGFRIDGSPVRETLTGVQAVAAQHELDHLDGLTFLDRVGKTARRLAVKRLKKLEKKYSRQVQDVGAFA